MVPEPPDQVEEADGRQTEAGAAAGAPPARPLLRGRRDGVRTSTSPAAATPDIRGNYMAPSPQIMINNSHVLIRDTGRGSNKPGAVTMLGNRVACKCGSCRTSNLKDSLTAHSAPK